MLRVTGCLLGVLASVALTASAAPVRVNLRTELDSRRAKVGDMVQAKLEAPLNVNGLSVPKGAVVLGHVQQVKKKDARGRGEITLIFDQVVVAGAQPMAVTAKIVTVQPSPYVQIPDARCDGINMRALSSERSSEMFCDTVPRFKVLHAQDGNSGTVTSQITERGPNAEASAKGPLMLAKGTLMDVEILPAR